MPKVNIEGLTFCEWMSAAQCFGAKIPANLAHNEWLDGIDPTEYASYVAPPFPMQPDILDKYCKFCGGPSIEPILIRKELA